MTSELQNSLKKCYEILLCVWVGADGPVWSMRAFFPPSNFLLQSVTALCCHSIIFLLFNGGRIHCIYIWDQIEAQQLRRFWNALIHKYIVLVKLDKCQSSESSNWALQNRTTADVEEENIKKTSLVLYIYTETTLCLWWKAEISVVSISVSRCLLWLLVSFSNHITASLCSSCIPGTRHNHCLSQRPGCEK